MPVAASQKDLAGGPLPAFRRGLARLIGVGAGLFLALCAAGPATAQAADAGQQAFAKAYVAALRSQDEALLKATIHPATLACVSPANRAYFDAIFKSQLELGQGFGPEFSIRQVVPVTERRVTVLPAQGFAYPVQPAYRMQINAEGPGRSLAIQAYVAPGPGGWFAVHPCPNAAGMRYFAELSPKRRVDGAVVERLDAGMPPRLREEIVTLLGQDRFIDAVDRYVAAAGVDASTATMVVRMQRDPKAHGEGH